MFGFTWGYLAAAIAQLVTRVRCVGRIRISQWRLTHFDVVATQNRAKRPKQCKAERIHTIKCLMLERNQRTKTNVAMEKAQAKLRMNQLTGHHVPSLSSECR